jgi:hypothetical protein
MIELAEQMLSEATEPHLLTEDNLSDIQDEFARIAGGKFRDGRIVMEVERLVVDVLWQRVNARAGRRTQTLITDLVAGQLALSGVDRDLDLVITIGRLRRTTLRHLNRSDVTRLIEVRAENVAKASAAYDQMRQACRLLDRVISEFGSIPEALAAGALHVVDDTPATGEASA